MVISGSNRGSVRRSRKNSKPARRKSNTRRGSKKSRSRSRRAAGPSPKDLEGSYVVDKDGVLLIVVAYEPEDEVYFVLAIPPFYRNLRDNDNAMQLLEMRDPENIRALEQKHIDGIAKANQERAISAQFKLPGSVDPSLIEIVANDPARGEPYLSPASVKELAALWEDEEDEEEDEDDLEE